MSETERKSPEYVPAGPVRLHGIKGSTAVPPQVLNGGTAVPADSTTSVLTAVEVPTGVRPTQKESAPNVAEPASDIPAPGWHPDGWTPPAATAPLTDNDTPAENHPDEDESATSVAGEGYVVTDEERLSVENVRGLIVQECRAVERMLLDKNEKYGNSFAHPMRIFAREVSAEAQVRVRIDDKLSRIANGYGEEVDEDTVEDLIGYLLLHRVQKRLGM